MKLNEGLGLVNNLIFFRSFFSLRSLNLSATRSCSVSVIYFLLTFRVDWNEAPEWMLTPRSQDCYNYCHFASAPKKRSLHRLLGLDRWLVRSPKVHSKSSRLAEMDKLWKGVDLQFHFLPASFFFSFLFPF